MSEQRTYSKCVTTNVNKQFTIHTNILTVYVLVSDYISLHVQSDGITSPESVIKRR